MLSWGRRSRLPSRHVRSGARKSSAPEIVCGRAEKSLDNFQTVKGGSWWQAKVPAGKNCYMGCVSFSDGFRQTAVPGARISTAVILSGPPAFRASSIRLRTLCSNVSPPLL